MVFKMSNISVHPSHIQSTNPFLSPSPVDSLSPAHSPGSDALTPSIHHTFLTPTAPMMPRDRELRLPMPSTIQDSLPPQNPSLFERAKSVGVLGLKVFGTSVGVASGSVLIAAGTAMSAVLGAVLLASSLIAGFAVIHQEVKKYASRISFQMDEHRKLVESHMDIVAEHREVMDRHEVAMKDLKGQVTEIKELHASMQDTSNTLDFVAASLSASADSFVQSLQQMQAISEALKKVLPKGVESKAEEMRKLDSSHWMKGPCHAHSPTESVIPKRIILDKPFYLPPRLAVHEDRPVLEARPMKTAKAIYRKPQDTRSHVG